MCYCTVRDKAGVCDHCHLIVFDERENAQKKENSIRDLALDETIFFKYLLGLLLYYLLGMLNAIILTLEPL